MTAVHESTEGQLGLPYAPADFDGDGYYVTCPRCGAKCRPPVGARSEDAVTKGALAAYQQHWSDAGSRAALAHAMAVYNLLALMAGRPA